jgi:hypothetical protein
MAIAAGATRLHGVAARRALALYMRDLEDFASATAFDLFREVKP